MISFSQQRGGAIKSIQRGVILLTGANLSKTVTITPVNPAFAAHLSYPGLADGTGVVMVSIAVFATLVTVWEIVDAFRKSRRSTGATPVVVASIAR